MNLLVDFVSNIIKSLFNENDLIYIIKLCEKELTLIVMYWFKILENLDHKVLVFKVAPRVEAVPLSTVLIRNAEIMSEALQESHKQEVSIYLSLYLYRKLLN
jgi:hypothetical protein